MSDEYEYGPWIELPRGAKLEAEYSGFPPAYILSRRYRILSPKPRREFVVGKWYKRASADWAHCIAVESGFAWLAGPTYATRYTPEYIDWSVSPRDEAPE